MVTWIAGFIGFHLGKRRLDRGDKVIGLENTDDIVEGVTQVIDRVPKSCREWRDNRPDPGSSFAPYKPHNIDTNKPVKLLKMTGVLEERVGHRVKKNLLHLQPSDVLVTYANVDDLMHDVGFKPDTPIEFGLERFVKWYRSYYGLEQVS